MPDRNWAFTFRIILTWMLRWVTISGCTALFSMIILLVMQIARDWCAKLRLCWYFLTTVRPLTYVYITSLMVVNADMYTHTCVGPLGMRQTIMRDSFFGCISELISLWDTQICQKAVCNPAEEWLKYPLFIALGKEKGRLHCIFF